MNKPFLPFVGLLLLALIITPLLTAHAQSDQWIFRLGAVGTGTGDKGIWTFNAASGLGPQEFVFSNSWGAALDVDYLITPRWTAGIHFALSSTSFGVNIDQNGTVDRLRDHTSFTPLMAEVKHRFRPDKNFNPYLGISGGIMFNSDVSLAVGGIEQEFEFTNAAIYGVVFGFDWGIGSDGWAAHMLIRATTFEYTMQASSLSDEQTLLDQHWWQNFNHIQLGISKRL